MEINNDYYGVFIMHEQLKLNGLLETQYDDGLDIVWQCCIDVYNDFQNSEFNDPKSSEYDCIIRYVQSLDKSSILN